eukprot:33428-Pyramimonas_sp.AAC.1
MGTHECGSMTRTKSPVAVFSGGDEFAYVSHWARHKARLVMKSCDHRTLLTSPCTLLYRTKS